MRDYGLFGCVGNLLLLSMGTIVLGFAALVVFVIPIVLMSTGVEFLKSEYDIDIEGLMILLCITLPWVIVYYFSDGYGAHGRNDAQDGPE